MTLRRQYYGAMPAFRRARIGIAGCAMGTMCHASVGHDTFAAVVVPQVPCGRPCIRTYMWHSGRDHAEACDACCHSAPRSLALSVPPVKSISHPISVPNEGHILLLRESSRRKPWKPFEFPCQDFLARIE